LRRRFLPLSGRFSALLSGAAFSGRGNNYACAGIYQALAGFRAAFAAAGRCHLAPAGFAGIFREACRAYMRLGHIIAGLPAQVSAISPGALLLPGYRLCAFVWLASALIGGGGGG